jgi:hypothetical protein
VAQTLLVFSELFGVTFVARLFGFSVPPWFEQARPSPRGNWSWRSPIVEERREIRHAYEHAISRFADASSTLYRRAADGVPPTTQEMDAFLDAKSRLDVARAMYQENLWH